MSPQLSTIDEAFEALFRRELGPISLHSVEQVTTLTVDSLPDFEAQQVEASITVDSRRPFARAVRI